MRCLMKNNNSLFYVCSLLEYISRICKIQHSVIIKHIGKDGLKRLYKDSSVLHCEPIEKIADEIISFYKIEKGTYDNLLRCHYDIPDYWTIGEVFERLIEDICDDNDDVDFIIETLIKVYSSWIDEAISNFNSDFFYQSRQYIYESWKEGAVIQEAS